MLPCCCKQTPPWYTGVGRGAGGVMVFRTSAFRPSIGARAGSMLSAALVIALMMSAARPSFAQTAKAGAQVWPADNASEDEADSEDANAKDAEAKDADAKDA